MNKCKNCSNRKACFLFLTSYQIRLTGISGRKSVPYVHLHDIYDRVEGIKTNVSPNTFQSFLVQQWSLRISIGRRVWTTAAHSISSPLFPIAQVQVTVPMPLLNITFCIYKSATTTPPIILLVRIFPLDGQPATKFHHS